MAFTSNCLRIVNAMPQWDQDALLARMDELIAQGLRPAQAQVRAAEDTLAKVLTERDIAEGNTGDDAPNIRWSPRRGEPPKKTVKAYKLFRVDEKKPGQLFPLFVDANTPVPMGEWLDADIGPSAKPTKTGLPQVKSKLGGLAFRPGWHAGDLPLATHIGGEPSRRMDEESGKIKKLPTIRPENQVWAEIEMAADRDWQTEANKRGTNSNGKLVAGKAHITDQIPVDGFYRYKTNANMTGNWLIGGSMKVNRILSDAEVKKINKAAGVADLPRKKPFDVKKYGFDIRKSNPRDVESTPEFKQWFDNSKVVDEQGRPLIVYHGTSGDFNEFDPNAERVTDDGYMGAGFYFETNPYTASQYAASSSDARSQNTERRGKYELDFENQEPAKDANVLAVYLSIKNPYNLLREGDRRGTYGMTREEVIAWTNDLKARGYDGAYDGFSEWVAFYPEQIKSAIGNNGEFDGSNPDIRKSASRLIEDIPNEEWLQGKIRYAQEKGRDRFGVPHRGSITGYFNEPVEVSLRVLSKLKGERDEQNNVRQDSLDYIRKNWDEVSKQPPYIEVAYNGEAWVSEGNHRIMVAAEKGIESMPVEIRYFDGGQLRNGPLAPSRIPSLEDTGIRKSNPRDVEKTPEFKRWFGKSKVKAEDGKPQVMYHATTRGGFDVFDRMKTTEWRRESMDTVGSWFSDSPGEDGAGRYVPGDGATIYPVYLRIEKPKVYKTFTSFLDDMHKAAGRDPKAQNPRGVGSTTELRQKLKAQGYDGIHFTRTNNKGLLEEIRELDDLIRTYERKDPQYADELRDERKKVKAQYEKTGGSTEFDDQDVWVAFEPNQIKSAIGNNGDFDINNPSIIKSADREISPLGFYSALADGIAKVQSKELGAMGWKQALKAMLNKGQVKQDEIDWSGINEFLDLQQGKISKDAVLEYLRGNGVQVQETVLGGDGYYRDPQGNRVFDDESGDFVASKNGGSKFASYGPPGGENYREVLLTLPVKESGGWVVTLGGKKQAKVYASKQEAEAAASEGREEFGLDAGVSRENQDQAYISGHWDQKNVIAHIRVDDRTDADGKRVLFIREIQSDWGQGGKKKGFQLTEAQVKANAEKELELRRRVMALRQQGVKVPDDGTPASEIDPKFLELQSLLDQENELRARNAFYRGLPPAAPFVQKTDAWVSLALKRAIVMAAQEGYDKVALINGEQAADMFDLSRQIDSVYITKLKKGGFEFTARRDGSEVISRRVVQDADALAEVVGKDLAEKADQQELDTGKRYSGIDLKVGGEGMKAFYDKIVPKVAKDVVKKLGGQMGTVKVAGPAPARNVDELGLDNSEIQVKRDASGNWYVERGERYVAKGDGRYWTGDAWSSDDGETRMFSSKEAAQASVTAQQQIGFDITPAMREKVAAGVPLFSRDRQNANPDIRRSVARAAQTDEFKSWSRNAPLVLAQDALSYGFEDGKPFVAQTYHGTNAEERNSSGEWQPKDFDEFSDEALGQMTAAESANMGHFSTSEPIVAGSYASNLGMGRYLGLAFNGAKDLNDDPEATRLQKAVDDTKAKYSETLQKVISETADEMAKNAGANLSKLPEGALLRVAQTMWRDETFPGAEGRIAREEAAQQAMFTAERELSSYISDREAEKVPQRIMPLFVRMSNPKVYDAKGKTPGDFPLSERIAAAKKAGHDGVVFKNIADPSPVAVHYVSFKNSDIKSVFSRDFEEGSNISKSSDRDVSPLGFYSALADGVTKLQSESMGAPGWKQALKAMLNKGQVKQDEIDWSGISEWLDLQQGKIAKGAVLEYLRSNGVQVEETVLGGAGQVPEMLRNYLDMNGGDPQTSADWIEIAAEAERDAQRLQRRGLDNLAEDRFRVSELANDMAERLETGSGRVAGATKYSSYGPPGGDNYREVLLTLPNKSSPSQERRAKLERLQYEYSVARREGNEAEAARILEESRAIAADDTIDSLESDPRSVYRSSHWDQANVLAHIRVDDRQDADGKRVLFIREIQSDWGQEAKRLGFEMTEAEKKAERKRLRDEHNARVVEESNELAAELKDVKRRLREIPAGQSNEGVRLRAREDDILAQLRALAESSPEEPQFSKTPRAPFVGKTDAWVGLALKRAIIMSAQEGYDRVALINGQQAADMFDLSKQVDKITIGKAPSEYGKWQVVARKDGDVAIDRFVESDEELASLIGKDLAEKAIGSNGGSYSGLDLRVGGQGMKAFYDNIVPKVAKDVLKKLGGQVSEVRTQTKEDRGAVKIVTASGGYALEFTKATDLSGGKRASDDVYPTYDEAEKARDALAADVDRLRTTQLGFDITPEMREKVEFGLPLFSRDRAIKFTVDRDLQNWATKVLSGADVEPVVVVTDRLPHPSLRMAGLPKRPVTISRMTVRHIRKQGHVEITPEVIGKIESMLSKPRIVVRDTDLKKNDGVARFQILAADRDNLNRPILIAMAPEVQDQVGNNLKESDTRYEAALKGKGTAMAVDEVRTMFGRADSLNYVLRNLAEGNVIYMPEEEIAQLRKVIAAEIPPAGKAGGNPLVSRAKTVSIASDEALKKFSEGNQKWADYKVEIEVPVLTLEGRESVRDVRFSADRPWFDDLEKLKVTANYQLGDLLKTSKKLSWWDRTVGTQYNLAQKHPQFKRVFDAVQRFINDVSAFATRAADMAPNILPKLETLKDIAKSPLSAEDVKALRDPIFGGTLNYARDEEGQIISTDEVSEAGVVFSDDELRSLFNLNDRQIGLYREFRRAVDQSIADLAISDMLRYAGQDAADVREEAMASGNVDVAVAVIERHLRDMGAATPERQAMLEATIEALNDKADQANRLMDRGYAPLSRFGQYTVYAVGQDGEQIYFSMFENERDANKMAREMRDQYPDATVTTGTMSEESYKLFSGVTPETLALFGDALGLEESGIDTKSEAFQTMLKVAKTNRSAMKRLIQRKGIDGFSEDAGRVLAGFVYSNARQISTNLHAGEIGRAASEVKDGDLKDAAIRLMQYVQNPQEEAQAIRGLLFTQFIGGSIASAMVNMTQPFTMTLPYLSQFAGVTGAGKLMADAVKLTSRGIRNDDDLAQALKRAEDEGVVSPQEVHQLMAQARGKGSLQSGDGTRVGDAAAKANNFVAKVGLGWGKLFSAAEQFNRRVTFIAAYKMAREQGMENPFQFAEQAIAETQGVYNKGNKPAWARGAVGGTLFTFKQYSIAYVEFLRRMWGNGPEGKKAVGLALAVLFMTAGLGGMPGADDLDDVIDGFAQRVLGKSFDSKQAKKEFFASILGQSGAEFVMSGLTGLPGAPIDLSGRLGLGNLIPGTGILTKKKDYGRDVAEVFGPAGSFFANIASAAGSVAQGEIGKAAELASPVAIQNVIKGADMAAMGMYRDTRGRKVIDVEGWEAAVKAIGFQPGSVKRVQDATSTQQGLIAQNKLRETEIADKWAAGRIERNADKVREAQEELAEWNRKNPQSPIRIDQAQINKRVQEANKSKAARIAATAPKEIRETVKRELASQ